MDWATCPELQSSFGLQVPRNRLPVSASLRSRNGCNRTAKGKYDRQAIRILKEFMALH